MDKLGWCLILLESILKSTHPILYAVLAFYRLVLLNVHVIGNKVYKMPRKALNKKRRRGMKSPVGAKGLES